MKERGETLAKVMVAMSGGVDSSVAAALLLEQGYDVCGGTLRLYEQNKISGDVERAKSVCEQLGIKHFVFDERDLFREKVINYFADAYMQGITPNPCIECNRYLKFGILLGHALELGCDYIATGHYSRIARVGERYAVVRPADRKKDQTYVLWRLNQHQLSHMLMPLGDLTKDKVREIAFKYSFVNADAKESQDICFVPYGDYAAFLNDELNIKFAEGEYIDVKGAVLGKHRGHQCYTIGQRKGLGIALGEPRFVISKDALNNTVMLGGNDDLFKKRVYINEVNLSGAESLDVPLHCTAKLRYSAQDTECVITKTETGAMIDFAEPVRAVTAGQSAVFYSGDIMLGGGIILKGE